MAVVYENWERLVRAILRREELRISALRTPSEVSVMSSFSSSRPSVDNSSCNFSGRLLVGDSFSYQQILQATNYLSSYNLIKQGRSGDLFYGVLGDGIQVAVKKVDLLSSAERESFLRSELGFLDKVSHPRFVPFIGHCLENGNEKFLVYKYMPNKDLSTSLFEEVVSNEITCLSPCLDWSTRLKIATGAAESLCYLHHECVPPLVHRNVEPRSILIDENFEARLGRFTEVCTESKDRNPSGLSRLLRLPKGYNNQGTSGASNATRAYDVYCFGKVLLELVTGKPGFSDEKDSSMRDWMENALACITTSEVELFLNIVDPSLIMDDNIFTEAWPVAIVAKACLNSKPSERPKMTYILEALQNPKSVWLSTLGSSQVGAVALPQMLETPSKLADKSQARNNTTFSGSSTDLQRHQFSTASKDDEVYQNKESGEPSSSDLYNFSRFKAFERDGLWGLFSLQMKRAQSDIKAFEKEGLWGLFRNQYENSQLKAFEREGLWGIFRNQW